MGPYIKDYIWEHASWWISFLLGYGDNNLNPKSALFVRLKKNHKKQELLNAVFKTAHAFYQPPHYSDAIKLTCLSSNRLLSTKWISGPLFRSPYYNNNSFKKRPEILPSSAITLLCWSNFFCWLATWDQANG